MFTSRVYMTSGNSSLMHLGEKGTGIGKDFFWTTVTRSKCLLTKRWIFIYEKRQPMLL